jgi:hypothetical protein
VKEDDLEAWLTRLNAALATRHEAMAELRNWMPRHRPTASATVSLWFIVPETAEIVISQPFWPAYMTVGCHDLNLDVGQGTARSSIKPYRKSDRKNHKA